MKTIAKNRSTFTRIALFNVLTLSTLAAKAGAQDKIKKMFGNDTDFLTIFGVIALMIVVCVILYLIGRYYMKKEELKNANRPTPKPSHSHRRRGVQRRR